MPSPAKPPPPHWYESNCTSSTPPLGDGAEANSAPTLLEVAGVSLRTPFPGVSNAGLAQPGSGDAAGSPEAVKQATLVLPPGTAGRNTPPGLFNVAPVKDSSNICVGPEGVTMTIADGTPLPLPLTPRTPTLYSLPLARPPIVNGEPVTAGSDATHVVPPSTVYS